METDRTLTGISRQTGVDKQAMQHFISQSPWSGRALIGQVQDQIAVRPELQSGAMLLLDESAEEKSGEGSVGTSRQYLGREGKVDLGQVGVFVALAKGTFWSWLDGDIYLPEVWFSPDYAERRDQVGVPVDRTFKTKAQLGLDLVDRVQKQGVPFEAVGCDGFYGHDGWFRAELAKREVEYMADVPSNQQVYLTEPKLGIPDNKRGPKAQHIRVLTPKAVCVDQVRRDSETDWTTLTVRATDRGELIADFAARRVWTDWVDAEETPHIREEWLVMRHDKDGKCYYALSNAPADAPLTLLAQRKCQRFFVERTNQDAKTELGWDDIQTTKFLAWQHHLALTIMAAWFIAETKLDWTIDCARDPALLDHYHLEVLPALSVANVGTLLCASLPLPQMSPTQAIDLVIEHLDNRARSRRSRLKNRSSP